MNVRELIPSVTHVAKLRLSEVDRAHDGSGSYVISTFSGDILFIGIGGNIRDCFAKSMSALKKPAFSSHRQPVFFHWRLATNPAALTEIWLKRHRLSEGCVPLLNSETPA